MHFNYIVVGGGIGGVSTLLQLIRLHEKHGGHVSLPSMALVSSSSCLRMAEIHRFVTKTVVELGVTDRFLSIEINCILVL